MTRFDALLPRPVRVRRDPGVLTLDAVPALEPRIDPALPAEGFRLTITPSGVSAAAADEPGGYYARQALRQLLGADAFRAASIHSGPFVLPCGEVEDHPRLGWRGCLLDVARHFLPKHALLRFVDLLAAHRLNVLHLHLTDDQGWRIEVPRLPRLTEVGAWRAGSWVGRQPDGTPDDDGRPHGGFYSVDDLRELVAYAAERHVTVVPEVDVPGHSQAAIAAYPWLGVTGEPLPVWTRWGVSENVLAMTERTLAFYRQVLAHVADVFPSRVICVGGDEAPGVGERRGWFVGELVAHLESLGRRAMAWDDAGPLPPGTIVGAWRGEPPAGHDMVLCPEEHVYLDHRQSDHPDEPVPVGYLRTIEDVYAYEPRDAPRVLGAQAQLWTEYLDDPRRVDYAAFPRLAAFAEVVWSPPGGRYADFERRLREHHLPRLDALGVEYRPLAGPHPWQTRPGVPGRPR